MKKGILFFCTILTTCSLTAFAYMNWGDSTTKPQACSSSEVGVCNTGAQACFSIEMVACNTGSKESFNQAADIDLLYNVASRFGSRITKEKLNNAKSIIDILPTKATKSIVSYRNVRVSILQDNESDLEGPSEAGKNEVLNAAQIKLLQSADYSTNIYIKADFTKTNALTGLPEDDYLTYYMTIVPEKEAEFSGGFEGLIEYLKASSKEATAIITEDQLKPGRVYFTILKDGTISNVTLNATSGYPSVDKTLVGMIRHMPGKWSPATNSKGEPVDQKMVFFFGLEGC